MGTLKVECPRCGASRDVDDQFYRGSVKCTRCRRPFSVRASLSSWKQLAGLYLEGKYVLREVLGVGSYAQVFRAEEIEDGVVLRSLAAKMIYPDPEFSRTRQVEELIASLRMSHPFIVKGVSADIINVGGQTWLYLLMELAEETLEERMQRGQLSLGEAWLLTEQIVSALEYLHRDPDRRVHRDIKPANILHVGRDWKLADFGLTYSMGRRTREELQVCGTERYLPPEGYDGTVTPAWDMWSFGVMLAEAITGQHPFENDKHLFYSVTLMEPQLPANMPSPFNEIIRGCLIKKRSLRWSAPQVLAALESARGLGSYLSACRWSLAMSLRPLQKGQARTKVGTVAGAHKGRSE